ncbi:STAS domain-containing protein [Dactylosporangium sp. AC04546]|uniref:STAS domain-containing protein n=1 Tax=Dactylosporangium sp. AC04546 TaxID=2862460 RepID=UPI001EE025A7|nr:STAS domain-containing protein [Dactylosporangium sp. AC04546]WVK78680.1 STAS domain-containing protein [Dactylosporangium sp. AC04546]
MTALLSRDGANFSLACDTCGQLVANLAPAMGTWRVAWSLFVEDGWRGAQRPTGPHACGRCPAPREHGMVEESFARATPAGRAAQPVTWRELDGVTVVELPGTLHLATHAHLHDLLASGIRPTQHVVFDLSRLPSADSALLAVLVAAHEVAAGHGRRICLAGAADRVTAALRMLSVDDLLPNFADLPAALAWLDTAAMTAAY